MLLNKARADVVMERHDLDAVLLAQPNNFIYATDYLVPSTTWFPDRPFLALLPQRRVGQPAAVVPGWDVPDFVRRSWIGTVFGYAEFRRDVDSGLLPDWRAALDAALETTGALRRLGVEERSLPKWIVDVLRARHPDIALVDATATIRTIRAVKTERELRRLKRAVEITEEAVGEMLAALYEGMREQEAARIYAAAVSRQGGENIANFVLGFGPAGAVSHCIPGDIVLAPGDSVRFDLGARYLGYYADTAASRFWHGTKPRQERLYRGVLESQRAAAALLGPGVPVCAVYEEAIRVARRFIPTFRMEHVGHGIGVEHHENPPLIGGSEDVLEPDMVINVETLFLDPEEGGFAVEDTYRITPTGAEKWTSLDRTALLG